MLDYQQLLDIGLAPDAEALQTRLIAAAAALGFGLSSATHIRGRLGSGKETVHALFCNTPAAFLEASRSVDAGLKDPLLAAVLAGEGCFTYDQSLYADSGTADLWDNQAAFGYRHGMAVSMHEYSHLETFSFGVDGPDALPADPGARLELEANLRLIGLHAKESAKRLWTAPAAVDLNALTLPEMDSLRWAADAVLIRSTRGKVVISMPGRAGPLRAAARKLGATSGSQALLLAIKGGLVDR